MKSIFLFKLFLFISIPFALAQKHIDLPELDHDYPDIDTVISSEDYLLKVNIDTLYIMNLQSIQAYKQCRESYEELLKETNNLSKVDEVIKLVNNEFSDLNLNIKSLETKYESSLKQNIETNQRILKENKDMEKELIEARKNLTIAQQKIKAEKWNSKTNKLFWGIGGFFVGGAIISLIK